jgi:hypothetical protein
MGIRVICGVWGAWFISCMRRGPCCRVMIPLIRLGGSSSLRAGPMRRRRRRLRSGIFRRLSGCFRLRRSPWNITLSICPLNRSSNCSFIFYSTILKKGGQPKIYSTATFYNNLEILKFNPFLIDLSRLQFMIIRKRLSTFIEKLSIAHISKGK